MSFLDHAPSFSTNQAIQLANQHYNLKCTANNLPSERDQNFILHTENNERFVLKIANGTEERAILEAQNGVMGHVAKQIDFCPHVIPDTNGSEINVVRSQEGKEHFVRLVSYLPGSPLGDVKHHSHNLLFDLGQKIGQLTAALTGFDHPALHRDFHWDLANGQRIISQNAELIQDKSLQETVLKLASDFEAYTARFLPGLPRSIIHNDTNDYNLLASGGDLYTYNQSIVGLLDFGDLVYSYTISDLAIAIAYTILGKPDPLGAATQIVRGFYSTRPLMETELAALFGLVNMRLCMSASIAADQQARQPENKYLGISQALVRETLPKLATISPRFAEAVFREACGLLPFPASEKIADWLTSHSDGFASPLEFDLRAGTVTVLDLSVSSPLLDSDPAKNEEPFITPRINAALTEAGAQVGVGRYDEARYFYTSSAFATRNGGNVVRNDDIPQSSGLAGYHPAPQVSDYPTEYRTVHLGIDLFAPAGTPVYAPLDGKIVAFNDNNSPQDYGPVIVLEHEVEEQIIFYTLYGHLSRESLKGKTLGQSIQKGERLAALGESDANGGWTPHLHFQVITDLLELGADFPGVARPSQRDIWLSLCPDPNLILGIPSEKFPPREPDKAETLANRRQRLGRSLSISYREPLKIVRGWMQYLFDDEGRKYLDAYNNVAHVGHNHPRVVAAARRQMGVLNTNTRYLHDNILRYAEKLTSLLPEPLSVCHFVNSGSEANELALRLARAYTCQRDMIVLEAAYHGNTSTLIDISPYKHKGPGGMGTPAWVHIAPIPDDYRGTYKRDDPGAGAKYARHVLEITEKLKAQKRGLAGFIVESLPSVGGQIVPPPGYLADAFHYVRAAGGLCIVDDVQTGFGRVGTHFWGFEMQGVTPDIVVLGKPIGNGHPLGAVITTPEIADAFHNGMEYFTTFGGNPVSCAVGLEVLNVVLDENLQEHARRVGERMLEGLRPFVDRFSLVGDVRGSGLFLGVELVRDRETLEPAAEEADYVMNRMREHGVLLGTDGPYHNVLKIRPPMSFDEGNADFLVSTMEKILQEGFV
jgi:4-aminobutyrate aminotransferase-like enzyme/Ser/Thr protein kinase RdoA (MazF antagonist)